ncbi:MAG: four helix bundle suffix domain-containing protein [Verrucomicrobia bacterium]|nr:four helix bundle suffix domain-containing protein [Verrucomicrobiota bacterium]
MNFDPSGGYRWLDAYIMASVVQLATLRFCGKFLDRRIDPCGRQYDQMTQAARSGKENIIEGSERASTSKETEMKLTDVARASLGELRGDYETWLLRHGRVPWKVSSPEAKEVFSLRLDRPDYSKDEVAHDCCAHILAQYRKLGRWLDSEDSFVCANAQLILISRTINMLGSLLKAQGERFAQTGGFREQLTATRVATRATQQNAPECPECGKPMHKRRAKAGPTPGREFWGCTAYPDCRGIREIQPPA